MRRWGFLTNHGRVLVCIAKDPGVRLRDISDRLQITERTAFGVVSDLIADGYVVKAKDGRRNRYEIQTHRPLEDGLIGERTIGDVLAMVLGEQLSG